jgi:hypothetical protein
MRSANGSGRVQSHGGADERLQRFLVELVAFVDVDRPAGVAFEAGVAEAGQGPPTRRLRPAVIVPRLHHSLHIDNEQVNHDIMIFIPLS